MKCPEVGKLMAYLDGELAPGAAAGIARHEAACARCRARLADLAAEKQVIARTLSPFQQASQHLAVRTPAPGQLRNPSPSQGGSQSMSKYWKTVAAVAAAALVLGLYPPARVLAGQFLSVFRVEKVEVLTIDPAEVQELQQALENYGENYGDLSIDSFGQVEVAKLEGGATLPQADLPAALGEFELQETYAQPGNTVKITPDVEGINAFLQNMGAESLLPADLDGRTVTVTMPDNLSAWYTSEDSKQSGINIYRAAAPTLEVPEGVDILAVRQALLDLPFLPDSLHRALQGIDDWTKTLPVPAVNGQAEEVTLDGASGFFIQGRPLPANGGPVTTGEYYGPSVLAWYRDGIWTALAGPDDISREDYFALARELEAADAR